MGFFKWISRKFGEVCEKVGDAIGWEGLSDFGINIQLSCADKVAEEKPYDKNVANTYSTERLNEILMSFSEGYFQEATSIEKRCISLVEDYYDKLIEIVENVPNTVQNTSNLRALKSGKSRIAKTIKGGIKDPLSKRMSLDDSECLVILKMDSGIEKKKTMTRFTRKIIKEALSNLSQKVRTALNEQVENIEDYLSEISEDQERSMQAFKAQFDNMVRDNELDQSDKEKNCIEPMFLLEVTECISQILKSGV